MKKIFLQSITIIELSYGNKNHFKLVKNTLRCKFTTDYINHPKGWGQITEKAIVIYLHSTGVIDLNTMTPMTDTFSRDRINTEMQNTRRNGPTLNTTPSLRDIKLDENTLNEQPKDKIINPFDIKMDEPLPFDMNETLIEDITHKASFRNLRMSNIYIEKLLESPFLKMETQDTNVKDIKDPNNITNPFSNPFLDEDKKEDNNDQEDNKTTQDTDNLNSDYLNNDQEDKKQPRMYKSRQVIDGDNVIDVCSLEIANDDLKNYNFELMDND